MREPGWGRYTAVGLFLALALGGCWPGGLTRRDGGDESDAGTIGPGDLGLRFVALAPCVSEVDYSSNVSTVQFGGALGNVYRPACLIVRAGTTVTFAGAFAPHPLRASTRATGPSPITTTTSGSSQTVAFPTPGFYPYYCDAHGDNGGGGMAGVIEVVP